MSLLETLIYITIALLISEGDSLKIRELVVPVAVPSESSSVILDCDYDLEPSSSDGLVVKWFFNDSLNPVYQWILGRKPQDLGILKKRVNLDYVASQDPTKKYRAIKIESPTKELSGLYKCHVSTFDDEAYQERKMVVYTRAKEMELREEHTGDRVTLRCVGSGLYPHPNMTITSSHSGLLLPVSVEVSWKEGLYDIQAWVSFQVDELLEPTVFDCILQVPEANYTLHKSMVYTPVGLNRSWQCEPGHVIAFLISLVLLTS